MDKSRLQGLLDAETKLWAAKSYDLLAQELDDVAAYSRGEGEDFHQFEVQIVEHEETYLHILVSVDDASLRRSFSPLTTGFIVHRDGRVEL